MESRMDLLHSRRIEFESGRADEGSGRRLILISCAAARLSAQLHCQELMFQ